VLVPSRLRQSERDAIVDELVQRLLRRAPMHHSDDRALEERAEQLADRYFSGVRASSVLWVGNQRKRWGSCNPTTGQIRISDRLRPVPSWVLDAVLSHELAHLLEPSHSRLFRSLAARYPRMKEADTFLHGFSVGLEAANRPHSSSGSDDDESCEAGEFDDGADDDADVVAEREGAILTPRPQPAAAFSSTAAGDISRPLPGRLFDPSTWG